MGYSESPGHKRLGCFLPMNSRAVEVKVEADAFLNSLSTLAPTDFYECSAWNLVDYSLGFTELSRNQFKARVW